MSKKPKKSDYKPSAADQANASVAMAEYNKFKQMYDPLLRQMRDKSLTKEASAGKVLRGRANADTMQALSTPSLAQANRVDRSGDMAQALGGQLNIANRSAKDIGNTMRSNVLGIARKQAADAQTGMAQASRLATSEALTRAKNKQDVAQAKINAGVQIGSALAAQGYDNFKSTGNVFSAGKDPLVDPTTGGVVYGNSKREGDQERYRGLQSYYKGMIGG